MICSDCQRENPAGAKFCNACGAKLERVCPSCGQVNPPGSRFCNECGAPLTEKAKGKRQKAKRKITQDSELRTLDLLTTRRSI